MITHANTIWELVEQRAAESPDALLAIDEQDRSLTFGQFRDQALRVAAGLHALGVSEGSPVSWQLPTWLESLVLTGALSRLGAIQNPIIPMNRHREVGYMIERLESKLLIVPDEWRGFSFGDMANDLASGIPSLATFIVEDRALPTGAPSSLPPLNSNTNDDVRWVLFTSGTTSDPKGAKHTDATLMASSRNMCGRMRLVPQDRNAIAFPFTHIGGLTLLFADLMAGCASILVETFNDGGIAALSRHQVTLAGSGTPFNLGYLKAQRRNPNTPLFPNVRGFPGGGSPRPPELHGEMKEAFGAGIYSGFGLTETGFLAMADVDDPDDALATTEGRAYPGSELRIINAEGKVCGVAEEGEICSRGPMVMRGYLDSALDTAFDDEGFFHTGDLGTVDEQGYLRVTGRLKEIIIRKGENISAQEVEQLLNRHSAVLECAVIGLPDRSSGERCCAVIVLEEDAQPPDIHALYNFLSERGLSTYKIPEQIEFVPELPKNATGKVTKRVLVQAFSQDPSC